MIYILSPSFSGSTLLTMLLAQHPDIATIGELKATKMGPVKDYMCSCGKKLDECEFWNQLVARVSEQQEFSLSDFRTHFRFDSRLMDRIVRIQPTNATVFQLQKMLIRIFPGLHRMMQDRLDRNRTIVEACCELQKGSWILDGSKDPNRLLYFYASGLFDLKVIMMVRDGRAQAHSSRKKKRNNGSFVKCAAEWNKTIREMEYAATWFDSDHLFRTSYEELCASPEGVIAGILEFLGLNNEAGMIRFQDVDTSSMHILGNGGTRTASSLTVQLEEKWRTELTPDELSQFQRVAGSTNSRLGYISR